MELLAPQATVYQIAPRAATEIASVVSDVILLTIRIVVYEIFFTESA